MSTVDWKSVESQLRKKTHPQIQSQSAPPEAIKAEADLLKHIEDALKIDTLNPDWSPGRRD